MSNDANNSFGTYFAAAQPVSRFFIQEPEWKQSLYNALLFQPEIHITDMGLLGHPYVWNHIMNRSRPDPLSWLEESLKEKNTIIRKRSLESLSEIVSRYEENKFTVVDLEYAKKLSEIFLKTEPKFELWSNSMEEPFGVSYLNLLKSKFDVDIPATYNYLQYNEVGQELLKFWQNNEVKKWRSDWIELAAMRTLKSGEKGIRVSDLVTIASEQLNIPMPDETYTPKEIISKLPHSKKELKKNVYIFFKIISELYDVNFSNRIDCNNLTVNLDALTASIILPSENSIQEDFEMDKITEIVLPTLKEFDSSPSRSLTECRNSNEGRDYFKAINDWMTLSSSKNVIALTRSIQKYAEKICSIIIQKEARTLKELLVQKAQRYVPALLSGVGTGLVFQSPEIALVGTVGGSLTILIKDLVDKRSKVRIPIYRRITPDITIPKVRITA